MKSIGNLREKGVRRGCLEHKQVMIAEFDCGSILGTTVEKGRVGGPRLSGVPEMTFQAAPLVPLEETVPSNEEKSEDDYNNDPNSSDLDKVSAKVVDDRRVHVCAEGDGILFGDRKNRRVER